MPSRQPARLHERSIHELDHRSHIAITARLTEWATDAAIRRKWLDDCLLRHNSSDWGDLDDKDRAATTTRCDAAKDACCPATRCQHGSLPAQRTPRCG